MSLAVRKTALLLLLNRLMLNRILLNQLLFNQLLFNQLLLNQLLNQLLPMPNPTPPRVSVSIILMCKRGGFTLPTFVTFSKLLPMRKSAKYVGEYFCP
jgi:hypothetical protein